MRLTTPPAIRTLQRKLYVKAKTEPTFRFYRLYDKVYRADILAHAYALAKANGGAPGVDGETFEQIESAGRADWLARLREDLRTRRYQPAAVRRVYIPKAGGVGERPLGIPTIRDRVVQTAAVLMLSPIFEAGFTDAMYGYRPRRSAQQAVAAVHEALGIIPEARYSGSTGRGDDGQGFAIVIWGLRGGCGASHGAMAGRGPADSFGPARRVSPEGLVRRDGCGYPARAPSATGCLRVVQT